MVRSSLLGGTAAALTLVASASVAQAAPAALPVTFTVNTTFEEPPLPDTFTSDLAGCTSGTVADPAPRTRFTPWGGVYVGIKSFTCADGASGFDLRLTARFSDSGATGHWTLLDGWGDLEGLKGSGSLTGIPTESGIDDIYTGFLR